MSIDKRRWSVMFTKQTAVDIMKPVSGDETISAGGTGKALEMIDVALCSHDQLAGWDRLATRTARSAIPKQSDVIVPAQDHPALGVTRSADFPELSVTTGALEAATVPVGVHCVEEKAVGDLTPAASARLPGQTRAVHAG